MTTVEELDRMYEAETDRLIEEHFGEKPEDPHVLEAFKDVEIALKKLRECRDWLDEASAEDIPAELEFRVASYYDQMDDLVVALMGDLKRWKERRWV